MVSATMPIAAADHAASPDPANLPVNKVVPNLALPVNVVALRAESYSRDDKTVVISLKTKYSSVERTYSVPLKCFDDLVMDLQRLDALTDTF
jgi:hypothetical protein